VFIKKTGYLKHIIAEPAKSPERSGKNALFDLLSRSFSSFNAGVIIGIDIRTAREYLDFAQIASVVSKPRGLNIGKQASCGGKPSAAGGF